jgi:hypothetical protein
MTSVSIQGTIEERAVLNYIEYARGRGWHDDVARLESLLQTATTVQELRMRCEAARKAAERHAYSLHSAEDAERVAAAIERAQPLEGNRVYGLSWSEMQCVIRQNDYYYDRIEAPSRVDSKKVKVMLKTNQQGEFVGWGYSNISTFFGYVEVQGNDWFNMMVWAKGYGGAIERRDGFFVITRSDGETRNVEFVAR